MGLLTGALEWWEEWKLRVLVLSSMFVQFFLFFSVWVRRVPALRRLRVVVWMVYIGGDALAIYALATLFNRHTQQTSTTTTDAVGESRSISGRGLEVLWAPVLLIHLGGHVTLTAFSLEDNELWIRHIITLGSQTAVALYVFCKWWSGEQRLMMAAVVLFVFGILKLCLKPWALRRASSSQMLASTDVSIQRRREKGSCYPAWLTYCTSNVRNKKEGNGETGDSVLSLDVYVAQAKATMCEANHDQNAAPAVIAIRHTDYFVDLPAPYSGRLSDLRYLQNLPRRMPYEKKNMDASFMLLQKCLEDTFDLFYTRVGFTNLETLMLVLLPFLSVVSVVLFATSHKHGYNSRDIKVTYILFSCTAMLEFLLPICSIILLSIPHLKFIIEYLDGWHDMVSQCNLMSFYVRKKKPTFLMKFVFFECLREYVSKVWYTRQVPAACQITELVERHIKDGWNTFIFDATTYRRFGDLRGQLTLKKHQQLGLGQPLRDSLKVPFVKSVLLWHIATNICFHHPVAKASLGHNDLGIKMSDYMFYLLLNHAEMLLPSTRPGFFTITIYDLEDIFKNSKENFKDEKALAQEIIHHTTGDTLIHAACRLALSLMELQEEERWEIIQGVWVEMLCYSASRCRGYLHAKSLGEGGEYLTYVWLLWSYMGMETTADKIQNPESLEEKEIFMAGELVSPFHGGISTAGIPSPV